METKMYALVLYIDPCNSGGDVIDTIVAVSSEPHKLYELVTQKEQEQEFIDVCNEIDETGQSCWNNTDVTSVYYSVIELKVV